MATPEPVLAQSEKEIASAEVLPALNEFQRDIVYKEWWGAEARSRYFAALGPRFSRKHQILTFLSLLLSSGAIVAITLDPHIQQYFVIKLALSTATAAASLFSFVRQYAKRTFDCADLYHKWAKLANDYRDLWGSMYEASAPDRLRVLNEKGLEISKGVVHSMSTAKRLMKKSEDEAEAELRRFEK